MALTPQLRLKANLRVLAALGIIFSANPLLNKFITKHVARFNELLSKQKNTINYVSLFSTVFGSLYFIYPDSHAKLLDFLLTTLVLVISKVHWHELIKANKKLNNTWLTNVMKNLFVSSMLNLKADSLSKAFSKLKAVGYNNPLLAKSPFLSSLSKSFSENKFLVPLLGLGLSLNQNLLKLLFGLVNSANILKSVDLKKTYKLGKFLNSTAMILLAFFSNLVINNKSFYPRALVDYSIRANIAALYDTLFTQRIKVRNMGTYRKVQCLVISMVLVNLIKYVKDKEIEEIDFEDFPVSKLQYKVLNKIQTGVSFKKSTDDSGNPEDETICKQEKETAPEIVPQDIEKEVQTSRKASTSNKKEPIKLYDNDYTLQVVSDSSPETS